ncbi:hypothetical protein PM082_000681 [Marasmius tenuissimus]|nr:hypothetical protein PM082_000681 [Marasmius tenuissimus]
MSVSEPLKRLRDAIAGVGASHRAEHQFDRGACLEGTREAVLAILREWGLTEDQLLPICWLSGAAGVGKSSIALTIAKCYEEKGVLRALWGSPVGPQIVILDGLDECSGEETQLRILAIIQSACEQNPQFPLRFLICSRPEAWLREAFGDERLRKLSKVIVLDETFEPNRDIREYYLHHFREIASSPKYNHIPFPSPWPSERDLEILVERACGQFVYAATVIRFIKLAYEHPIVQLRTIIDKALPRRPGTSPYQQLDVLYDFILSVHPNREELLSVLAVVLVLPGNVRSPACIELVLGLPEGQVELTLRGMHSVLDIHGRGDDIRAHHTSFTDYLADQTRSLDFHINKKKQKRPIARQWLQNLATSRIRTYSVSQLYSGETRSFFKQWVEFCTSITKPSWKLLVDVQNVDLSFMCVHTGTASDEVWKVMFSALLPWLEKYGVPKHGSFKDKDKECLMERFRKRPECFHLEWPPGACPSDDAMFWVVEAATGCIHVEGRKPSDPCQMPYLTECRCELSGGIRSCDPQHVAYQEACMQLVRSCVPRLEKIIQIHLPGLRPYMPPVLQQLFHNLAHSLLLKHCHLDTELLSLCRSFFELVECGVKVGAISLGHVPGAKWKLVEWVEAFPDRFAEERESLKAQFLALCK